MDRDPRQSIGLVKMCTKTGINIPREYIQPYFIEKYENEKFVKIRKIQPHVPFKGTTAGDNPILHNFWPERNHEYTPIPLRYIHRG